MLYGTERSNKVILILITNYIMELRALEDIQNGKYKKQTIRETETAAGATNGGDSVPENVLEVGYDGKEKTLKERIALRKKYNEKLTEAITDNSLAEKIADDASDLVHYRAKLQSWTNGGTPYVDEQGIPRKDGEENGPTAYEAWRKSINEKNRENDKKQQIKDMTSEYASPHNTIFDSSKALNGQIDDFLRAYVKEHGEF
jgi:hypothetical protein